MSVLGLETIPAQPTKYQTKPTMELDEFKEYELLAKELGINNSAIINERIKRALLEEGISVYNYGQVVKYLDNKLGTSWEWRGVTELDKEHLTGWFTIADDSTGRRQVYFGDKVYTEAIPLPVLYTMKKIKDRIPDVHFYVSSPGTDPDPFLMISGRECGNYVIERWDEPGFREK